MLQKTFKRKCFSSLIDNINIHYSSDFLSNVKADKYFNILEQNLVYNTPQESKVKVFGKEYEIKRKQVAYGDAGTSYSFAGATIYAKSWNNNDIICKILKNIKKLVEKFTGQKFNFVLINRYENGNDKIGKHQDSEELLGNEPTIVGVSLGAVRDICFAPYKTNNNPGITPQRIPNRISLQLDHGSIFVMYHPTNTYWTHEIPERSTVKTPRISLTFRRLFI